jgi:indolepyruvate decarboxylase
MRQASGTSSVFPAITTWNSRSNSKIAAILARLEAAKSPAFLLDLDAGRFGVLGQIERLAKKLEIPVAALNTCKAAFDETSPLFAGIYLGVASSGDPKRG